MSDSAENGWGAEAEETAMGGSGVANSGGGSDWCTADDECATIDAWCSAVIDAIDIGGGVGRVIVALVAGDSCVALVLWRESETELSVAIEGPPGGTMACKRQR